MNSCKKNELKKNELVPLIFCCCFQRETKTKKKGGEKRRRRRSPNVQVLGIATGDEGPAISLQLPMLAR